jgi:hypothetical protein
MFLELKSHRVVIIGAALVATGFAGCVAATITNRAEGDSAIARSTKGRRGEDRDQARVEQVGVGGQAG